MQCPTLVRLPPGLSFSDDGSLKGRISFDPHRDTEYQVEFIAVSTAAWDDHSIGLVRLQISLRVEGNTRPAEFDMHGFLQKQKRREPRPRTFFKTYGTPGSVGNMVSLITVKHATECARFLVDSARCLKNILDLMMESGGRSSEAFI